MHLSDTLNLVRSLRRPPGGGPAAAPPPRPVVRTPLRRRWPGLPRIRTPRRPRSSAPRRLCPVCGNVQFHPDTGNVLFTSGVAMDPACCCGDAGPCVCPASVTVTIAGAAMCTNCTVGPAGHYNRITAGSINGTWTVPRLGATGCAYYLYLPGVIRGEFDFDSTCADPPFLTGSPKIVVTYGDGEWRVTINEDMTDMHGRSYYFDGTGAGTPCQGPAGAIANAGDAACGVNSDFEPQMATGGTAVLTV